MKWGMLIDIDRCTGCQSCTVACKNENSVQPGMFWNIVLPWESGSGSTFRRTFVPRPCMHCTRAPCVEVCPTGASYKTEDGLVRINYDRCIGCRYCMIACPYGARQFNWKKPWSEVLGVKMDEATVGVLAQYFNPEVPPRPKGVVEKCTFCEHRLAGKKVGATGMFNRPARVTDPDRYPKIGGTGPGGETMNSTGNPEDAIVPACVQACPPRARVFGDLDDPNSEINRKIRERRAVRLKEELGTEPQVYYAFE